ncbi:response regulator [Micromonospora sp. NPDC051141]|uniref:response regulator transcription factor n=1 Tax=Micromonospora sp. NPDC051141 TaxID=3364284 RepID=UPI003794C2AD
MSIRVLIADDQAMIRSGLRLILEDQPDITVVGEASDGVGAVAEARRLRPDVCLVDIRMPRLDGIEVTRALAGPPNPLRVIVVTTFDLDEYVYGALRNGAVGFLLKDAGPALLVEAVRAAHNGDALVSPSVTLRLLRHVTAAARPAAAARSTARLSARELEVVRAVARGRTNQEIAAELFISLSTVKSHLSGIQTKLGVRNRVEIAAWAWENRVVEGA